MQKHAPPALAAMLISLALSIGIYFVAYYCMVQRGRGLASGEGMRWWPTYRVRALSTVFKPAHYLDETVIRPDY